MRRKVRLTVDKDVEALSKLDLRRYRGEYVCVVNGRFFGHGPDSKALVEEAWRKFPGCAPLVEFVAFPVKRDLLY